MYLDHIFIKNSGAIEEIDLKLQFTEESTPKPTLIVGRNGTGKSNLLSYINDGLIEIAATRFADVAPITPQGSHLWHRRLGGDTRRAGTAYEFSTLKFKSENNIYQYITKSGTIPENEAEQYFSEDKEAKENITSLKDHINLTETGNEKILFNPHTKNTVHDPKIIENIYQFGSYISFTSERSETPYWSTEKRSTISR